MLREYYEPDYECSDCERFYDNRKGMQEDFLKITSCLMTDSLEGFVSSWENLACYFDLPYEISLLDNLEEGLRQKGLK